MTSTSPRHSHWYLLRTATLPLLFCAWSVSLVVSVSTLQEQVSSGVSTVGRYQALNRALASLSVTFLSSRVALGPATGLAWTEAVTRYGAALAALTGLQSADRPAAASAIVALSSRLNAIRFPGTPQGSQADADLIVTLRQALGEIDNAIDLKRAGLSRISRTLAGKWHMLNILVGFACLQSLVLGVFLAKYQATVGTLQQALGSIKVLKGLLPICSNCKKIRDTEGYWSEVEQYISTHSDTAFSHSVCQTCTKLLYPEFYDALYPQEKVE